MRGTNGSQYALDLDDEHQARAFIKAAGWQLVVLTPAGARYVGAFALNPAEQVIASCLALRQELQMKGQPLDGLEEVCSPRLLEELKKKS